MWRQVLSHLIVSSYYRRLVEPRVARVLNILRAFVHRTQAYPASEVRQWIASNGDDRFRSALLYHLSPRRAAGNTSNSSGEFDGVAPATTQCNGCGDVFRRIDGHNLRGTNNS